MASLPKNIRMFEQLGLDINYKEGEEDVKCTCLFCGDEEHFSLNTKTTEVHCWKCGFKGNNMTFLRKVYVESLERTTNRDLLALGSDRKVKTLTLKCWGVALNPYTRQWMFPAYNAEGKVVHLYRWMLVKNRRVLLGLSDMPSGMFGPFPLDSNYKTIAVCEGPWDGMALWQAVKIVRKNGQGTPKGLAVVAIPGCDAYQDRWNTLFSGKTVWLLYDNDYPKDGRPPAGTSGMQRTASMLAGAASPPKKVLYLSWGAKGYNPNRPDGYDLRDMMATRGPAATLEAFRGLQGMLAPVPKAWLKRPANAPKKSMAYLPCGGYRQLVMAWRKALRWSDGLDRALACMLASILSVKFVGDQLWIKVIGPPACGKSTLCEAISVNVEHVKAQSTLTGFFSGYQTDSEGKEDNSLVPKIKDKTLVIKDADALLQQPNIRQILSQARDLYDTTSRPAYRNKRSANYMGIRSTLILCGTASLRSLDTSELGARFLDCVIMDGIDEDFENDIAWMVVNKSVRNMTIEADGKPETHQPPELTKAMQLTGGYIAYLKENAKSLLQNVDVTVERMRDINHLARFVANMRARPSIYQQEDCEREATPRLIQQLSRLALCLAAVLNKDSVDAEVMRRVYRVAMDTCRGDTVRIVEFMRDLPEGVEQKGVQVATGLSEYKVRKLLVFLSHPNIGVVEQFSVQRAKGMSRKNRWRLTDSFSRLYKKVRGVV